MPIIAILVASRGAPLGRHAGKPSWRCSLQWLLGRCLLGPVVGSLCCRICSRHFHTTQNAVLTVLNKRKKQASCGHSR